MSELIGPNDQQFLNFVQQIQAESLQLSSLIQEDQLKYIQLTEEYHSLVSKYHDVRKMKQEEQENLKTLQYNINLQLHKIYKRAQTKFQSKLNIQQIVSQDQLDYVMPQASFDLREIQEPKNINDCLENYKLEFQEEKNILEQAITKIKILIKLSEPQDNSKSKKSQFSTQRRV